MNNKPSQISVAFIVSLLLVSSICSSAQTIHYVKPTATGTGDGSSWVNASASIQSMMDAATAGDEIWVAAGIYYPSQEPDGTTDSPRDFSFYLRNGIKLYGGFAGNETTISQRVLAANTSTLSGDVGVQYDFADNAYHVVLSVNNTAGTLADGFNIVKANANVSDSVMIAGVAVFRNKGGAICNYNSALTITNVNCDTSIADFGAGLYNNASSPVISNCSFAWNSGMKGGAGMCNENGSSPNISNSLFDDNHAQATGGIGGGMYNINSSPIITNVIFSNHTAKLKRGAMFNMQSSPAIFNSFFYANNSQDKAGGMYNMFSSPSINNCAFIKNGASYGGAMCNDSTSAPFIISTTFSDNGGAVNCDGILNLASSTPSIKNCIVLKSLDANPWIISKAITDSSNSISSVTYSDIEEGYTGIGNVDIKDPQFINRADADGPDNIFGTADDGYRLQNCSPLINAGNNIGVVATDITGVNRIQLGIADMGAYESSSNSIDSAMVLSIPDTNTTVLLPQAANALTIYTNNCTSLVAMIRGNGSGSSISGNTRAKVWAGDIVYDAGNIRLANKHYEILPEANAATATGRVTLYFTKMDFDAVTMFWDYQFNLSGLPTLPDDAIGKSNLRVLQYNGSSNDGTGLIVSYAGGNTVIDPADNDIVWNETQRRWEVSFDATGFGGFYVGRALVVVPVKWISINALFTNQNEVTVSWKVQEQEVSSYDIEQSEDGTHFFTVGTVSGKGDGENDYSFTKTAPQMGNHFYRIRQTSRNGNSSYSSVIKLSNNRNSIPVSIYPNPARTTASMQLTLNKAGAIQYRLLDNSGRVLLSEKLLANAGSTIIPLPTGSLSAGIYYVHITGESFSTQLVLIKQ